MKKVFLSKKNKVVRMAAIAMMNAVISTLGFVSCSNNDTGPAIIPVIPAGTETEQKKTEEKPGTPDVATGLYMSTQIPNVLIYVNKDTSTSFMYRFSGFRALQRNMNDITNGKELPIGADVVSKAAAVIEWLDAGHTSSKYTYNFENAIYHISNSAGKAYIRNETKSEMQSLAQITSDTVKKYWQIPSEGAYISKAAVKVNNEEKYVYAVIEGINDVSAEKISIYVSASNAVSDFSVLTAKTSITNLLFLPQSFLYMNDEWVVLVKKENLEITRNPLVKDSITLIKK